MLRYTKYVFESSVLNCFHKFKSCYLELCAAAKFMCDFCDATNNKPKRIQLNQLQTLSNSAGSDVFVYPQNKDGPSR